MLSRPAAAAVEAARDSPTIVDAACDSSASGSRGHSAAAVDGSERDSGAIGPQDAMGDATRGSTAAGFRGHPTTVVDGSTRDSSEAGPQGAMGPQSDPENFVTFKNTSNRSSKTSRWRTWAGAQRNQGLTECSRKSLSLWPHTLRSSSKSEYYGCGRSHGNAERECLL